MAQKLDWSYFCLCAFMSGMYLFNVLVISFTNARMMLPVSEITTVLTNLPLLTLVYVGALLEIFFMKAVLGKRVLHMIRSAVLGK